MRIIFSLLTLLLTSTASYAAGDPSVHILLEQGSDQESWTVRYNFSQPIRRAQFSRNANLFRAANWKVETPGIQVIKVDDHEELVSTDNRAFSSAEITLRSYYDETPKDYEFFLPFTDGSQLVYTGHLNLSFSTEEGNEKHPTTTLTFRTPNRGISFLGTAYNSEASWKDKTGDGTYVYFGDIQPFATDNFISILDPGLPAWARESLFQNLPKLFAHYTEKFHTPLAKRPTIFFNYKKDASGTGSGGGVLPGVVQLRIMGKSWENIDDHLEDRFLFLIAHEAAHLWNGDRFLYANETAYWMHEGSANALAFRAQRTLQFLGNNALNDRFSDQLNLCLEKIGKEPLNDASKNKNFVAYYTCGSTIGLITEAAIRLKEPRITLFDFWARLYAHAANNDYNYDQAMYFSTLEEMSGSSVEANEIKRFVTEGVESPLTFFKNLLILVKIDFTENNGKLFVRNYVYE